ncbi:MAG: hypothetical protein K6G88_07525 [Lachnospiraceae bacterium]|nr:hypothetical protein [Lachnospiraceae bacterium]
MKNNKIVSLVLSLSLIVASTNTVDAANKDIKVDVQTETMVNTVSVGKIQSKSQSETQTETQSEFQSETQTETQTEFQSETQTETQSESQSETQTETQSESQSETTQIPTTQIPTTEQPTTQIPTTEQPTTVAVGDTVIDTTPRKRTSKKISFSLKRVTNATKYEVEVSDSQTFELIYFSGKTSKLEGTISSSNFKNMGVLYIRARAYVGDTPGKWSEGVRVKLIKKSLDLIKYIKKRIGCPYLYGYKQPYEWDNICTKKEFKKLKKRWGNAVWASDKKRCVGKKPTDCSGLISAYIEDERGSIHYKEDAVKTWKIRKKSGRLNIAKLKRIPIGTAVWQEGHIGVFVGWIGNVPYYIAEDGSAYGCRLHALTDSNFTHALLLPDMEYSIKSNYQVTVKSNTKFYKSATSSKKAVTWYRKGSRLTIVAEKNGRGLVRDNSLKQNLWVDLKTVKKSE